MSEKDLQLQCEKYLKENDLIYIHLENQAKSKYRFSNTRKFKGFPDIVVFKFNYPIFFELKSEIGKLKIEQIEMIKKLNNLGYETFIIRDFLTFKDIIDKAIK